MAANPKQQTWYRIELGGGVVVNTVDTETAELHARADGARVTARSGGL